MYSRLIKAKIKVKVKLFYNKYLYTVAWKNSQVTNQLFRYWYCFSFYCQLLYFMARLQHFCQLSIVIGFSKNNFYFWCTSQWDNDYLKWIIESEAMTQESNIQWEHCYDAGIQQPMIALLWRRNQTTNESAARTQESNNQWERC